MELSNAGAFWLGIFFSLPLSILANLATPAVQRLLERRSQERLVASSQREREELERVRMFISDRGAFREYLLVAVLKISLIAAVLGIATTVLSMFTAAIAVLNAPPTLPPPPDWKANLLVALFLPAGIQVLSPTHSCRWLAAHGENWHGCPAYVRESDELHRIRRGSNETHWSVKLNELTLDPTACPARTADSSAAGERRHGVGADRRFEDIEAYGGGKWLGELVRQTFTSPARYSGLSLGAAPRRGEQWRTRPPAPAARRSRRSPCRRPGPRRT